MRNPSPKDGPAGKKRARFGPGVGGLLAVAVLAAALSGCGGGDKAGPAKNTAGPAENTAGSAKNTSAPPAAKAKPTTVLSLTGSGTKDTNTFEVGADWTLSYTFDCAKAMSAVDGKGNFIVFDKNAKLVNEMDKTGKGSTPGKGAGSHKLQIVSECDWTVKATG